MSEQIAQYKQACLHCQTVSTYHIEKRDFIYQNTKFIITDLALKICNHCGDIMAVHDLERFNSEKERFIKNRPSISEILKDKPLAFKTRWCNSFMCACSGAANCAGGLRSYLYTEEDWIYWKDETGKDELNEKYLAIEIPEEVPFIQRKLYMTKLSGLSYDVLKYNLMDDKIILGFKGSNIDINEYLERFNSFDKINFTAYIDKNYRPEMASSYGNPSICYVN